MPKVSICHLPSEILEQVFSFVDPDQLYELTEVCPRFNAAISSSYSLMSAFTVTWKKSKGQDMRPLLKSERKYQRINVEQIVGFKSNLQSFFSKHATTLSDVNFTECSFTSSEFGAAMKGLADNLKFIGMCDVNFEVDGDIVPIKFTKLNYMEIMYGGGDGYSSVINFFTGSKNVQVRQ
jgi:hypothetical protein